MEIISYPKEKDKTGVKETQPLFFGKIRKYLD